MGACRYKSQFEPVVSNTTGQMVQFRCCSRLRVSHGQNDGIYTSCKMTGGPVNGRPYYSCASRGSYDGAVMWRKDLRQWEFKAAKGSFPFHEFYHLDVVSDVDSLCPPYQIFSAFKFWNREFENVYDNTDFYKDFFLLSVSVGTTKRSCMLNS